MTDISHKAPSYPTPEGFSIEVEKIYLAEGGRITYLEIASDLLAKKNIDQEDGASLISSTLKQKIAAESTSRNLLKEKTRTVKLG